MKAWLKNNRLGLLTIALTWLIFFSRTLFTGELYFLDDLKIIYYPLEHVFGEFQRNFALPTWSNLFGFGQPLLAWGQLGFLTPLHILLRILQLPPLILLQVSILLHFAAGLLGMYLLLRHHKLRTLPSALGAIVFAFCGFNIGHLSHVNFYVATMLLPWLMLAISHLVVRPTRQKAALLALIAASVAVSGHPQASLYTLIIAGIFGILSLIGHWVLGFGHFRKVVLLTFLTGILFLGLSSITLLPLFEFLPNTERAGGLPDFTLYEFSYPPSHAITLLAPYFFGDHERYHGAKNFQELAAYVGILPLLLAPISLLAWKKHRQLVITGFVLVAIAFAFAPGIHSPIYRYLVDHRWLTSLAIPGRFVYFFNVGMAILAAVGLQTVSRGWRGGGPPTSAQRSEHLVGVKTRTGPAVVEIALIILTSANLIWWGWNYNPLTPAATALAPPVFQDELRAYQQATGLPPRLYSRPGLAATLPEKRLLPTHQISPLFTVHQPITVTASPACFTIPMYTETDDSSHVSVSRRQAPDAPALQTIVVSAADIRAEREQTLCFKTAAVESGQTYFLSFSSQTDSRINLYYEGLPNVLSAYFVRVPNPTQAELAQSHKHARLIMRELLRPSLEPDVAILPRHLQAVTGASSARWISALSIFPYREFIERFLGSDADSLVDGDGVHVLKRNRQLLNMVGVTHLVQSFPRAATDNLPDLGFPIEAEFTDAGTVFRLYRNPDAFPKAYLVPQASYLSDLDKVLHAIGQADYDPAKLIYVNRPVTPAAPQGLGNHSVTIHTYSDTYVDVDVTVENDAWLVVTDSTTPEWQTLIDGQVTPHLTANSIFKAAYIPAGHHRVEFRYASPATTRAVKLSSISVVIALVLMLPVRSKYVARSH